MSEKIETKIQTLLLQHHKPHQVFVALFDYLTQREEDIEGGFTALINFAINAGLHQQAWGAIESWHKLKRPVPWPQLIELIHRCQIPVNSHIVQQFLRGASEQRATFELVKQHHLDKKFPEVAEIRKQLAQIRTQETARNKNEMLDQLSYYQNNFMVDQEKELLEDLAVAFPDDSNVQKLHTEFSLRYAQTIIGEHRYASKERADLDDKEHLKLSESELVALAPWRQTAEEIAQVDNNKAYDLAIGLHFVGDFATAEIILSYAPSGLAADWFKAELLVNCRRYVDALEWIQNLELRYQNDPETTFASVYLRAQCLRGLGKTAEAIELLGSVVNMRPHYRSSHSLLLAWQEQKA